MLYRISIEGIEPLIQHSARGLDPFEDLKREAATITKKRGSNRTEADDARLREIDCELSLWLDDEGRPTVPPAALRSCIETGARKLKQGGQVREGMIVLDSAFTYDREALGETVAELSQKAQFTVPVRVGQSRVLRTRARFDEWAVEFTVECDPEQVDATQLAEWLDIAGRRIGLGDWRPEKSGRFGRFKTLAIEEVEE